MSISIVQARLEQRAERRRRKRALLLSHPSVVYFIRGADAVKIGMTDCVAKRMSTLQSHSPVKLSLVGMIYGGLGVESWCHLKCFQHHKHGEWFYWNAWTAGFVGWMLGHGDQAASIVCPPRVAGSTFRVASAIWAIQGRPSAGDRKLADCFGGCECHLCESKPWESWA